MEQEKNLTVKRTGMRYLAHRVLSDPLLDKTFHFKYAQICLSKKCNSRCKYCYMASIDSETGILRTNGIDESNNEYARHPDTGIPIKGFKIPQWEEAVDLAKKLACVVPTNRYIGWDLALTDHGWVMVEGNSSAQMGLHQFCDLKGMRKNLDELCRLI